MNQEYMKTRKILPLVLSMSLPMVISMAAELNLLLRAV